ncbi:MAG TPA: HNH endonuclease [Acidimicrobiales bacterium]
MWTGTRVRRGYGQFSWREPGGRRHHAAHRFAWRITHGAPGKLFVLHRCDNTSCVRPDHLFLGTQADNMQDKITKGRAATPALIGERTRAAVGRGEDCVNSKLTWRQVRSIRASRSSQRALARRYGVTRQNIRRILRGETWKEPHAQAA